MFENEESEANRAAIIKVLTKLRPETIVPFLLKKMRSENFEVVADSIYICGSFKDPNSIFYIEKYLDHKDPKVRANAIIALWQFKKLRPKLEHYLDQMLESKKEDVRLMAAHVIGELNLFKRKHSVFEMLKELDHPELLFVLAKLSAKSALTRLIDYIMANNADFHSIDSKIKQLPKKFASKLRQYLYHEATNTIHKILVSHSHLKPEEFDKETLTELMHLYGMIHEINAQNQIKRLIKEHD